MEKTSDAGDIITANFLDFPPNFRLRTWPQYRTFGNEQRHCPFPRCLELISGWFEDLSFAPFGRSGQMTHASSHSQPKIWRKIQKIGGDNITSINPFSHVWGLLSPREISLTAHHRSLLKLHFYKWHSPPFSLSPTQSVYFCLFWVFFTYLI